MKNHIILLVSCQFLLFTSCNRGGVDTVKDNPNEVKEEAVANFDYTEIQGTFKGPFQSAEAILTLDGKENYTLKHGARDFKGKYYFRGAGGIIELEYMEYQTSLPFYLLAIEDPTFLTIIVDEEYTDYFLEKVE